MSVQTTYDREAWHIPLGSAYLCLDCNAVCNSPEQCPACASEALMGLAGVLQREEIQEATCSS